MISAGLLGLFKWIVGLAGHHKAEVSALWQALQVHKQLPICSCPADTSNLPYHREEDFNLTWWFKHQIAKNKNVKKSCGLIKFSICCVPFVAHHYWKEKLIGLPGGSRLEPVMVQRIEELSITIKKVGEILQGISQPSLVSPKNWSPYAFVYVMAPNTTEELVLNRLAVHSLRMCIIYFA